MRAGIVGLAEQIEVMTMQVDRMGNSPQILYHPEVELQMIVSWMITMFSRSQERVRGILTHFICLGEMVDVQGWNLVKAREITVCDVFQRWLFPRHINSFTKKSVRVFLSRFSGRLTH